MYHNTVSGKVNATVDVIDGLIREVLSAFESMAFAQATLSDLSKAFDCVIQ